MTDIPDTFAELDELWAGTVGPTEHSPTIHPSMLPRLPRVLRVVGSIWEAHETPNGNWDFVANGEVIWADMAGDVGDAFQLLLQVHRTPSPRAETQGPPEWHVTDPLRAARGILCATGIMACVYAAVFAVLRWRGVL
jgi:hypothetical protein